MELSAKQQSVDLIKRSKKILILGPFDQNGDSLGSALALSGVLKELGKEANVVVSGKIPETLRFLPGTEDISGELKGNRDLIIKVKTKDKSVGKLSYNVKDDFLNIVISPKETSFQSEDVILEKGGFKYDLIIVLDTSDVDKLDKIYDNNTELFFEIPVLNIDHHVGNEHFGTANVVDITSTSTAEILVALIEALGIKISEEAATCLLTGIIADTGSFKKQNTTPKSLTVSAQLLAAGAKKQEIVDNLYKTKYINTLKLWGKLLSKLEHEKEDRFLWSIVDYKDFSDLDATIEDVKEVMDELVSNTSGVDLALLLTEYEPNKVFGQMIGQRGTDVLKIAEFFGGSGEFHSATFTVENASLEKTKSDVLDKIREIRGSKIAMEKPDAEKKIVVPLHKIEKKEEPKEDDTIGKEETHSIPFDEHKSEMANFSVEEALDIAPNDAITSALESLEKEKDEREAAEDNLEKLTGMSSLKEVLDNKFNINTGNKDIFGDEDEYVESGESLRKEDDDDDVRVWRPES